ncbi:hypothetical protein HHK36_015573 [Tetracentron sinense]|uniref:Uncharacterized protein n=1 Tax=Tetracentron sinense TaxID=13715 RepID=A0A835DDS4_TETSI|nr:hypothetical protein HHK36_015573 [Tetracentron sinense]
MSLSQPVVSQPVVVYPNTVSREPSHSKGSFGTVFIVLAVIIILSAIACFLGRRCNPSFSRPTARRDHTFHPEESDLEYGFKKMTPAAKTVSSAETKESKSAENSEIKGEKLDEHGVTKASDY